MPKRIALRNNFRLDGMLFSGVNLCFLDFIELYASDLLSNEADAKEIRQWFRNNSKSDEKDAWIQKLFELCLYIHTGRFSDNELKSRGLDSQKRKRKINSIINTINKLIRHLNDDESPDIPLVHELMDCKIWGCSEAIKHLREYCCKENDAIDPFSENMTDILLVLRSHFHEKKAEFDGKNKKGFREAREFAGDVFHYLKHDQDNKDVDYLVVLLVNIRYKDSNITRKEVSAWRENPNYFI